MRATHEDAERQAASCRLQAAAGSLRPEAWSRGRAAFTMIELLIVISIIAILAAAIIPNFIGFDAEAKVAATKSNLDTLRSRVTLYRAKEGKYPDSLDELVNKAYLDAGVRKPYLTKMPPELVSSNKGSNAQTARRSDEPITNEGGWLYRTDTAEVLVNLGQPLDRAWGDYASQKPSDW